MIERTWKFPRDRPINCGDWEEFQVVGITMRDVHIKYWVEREVDEKPPTEVECDNN